MYPDVTSSIQINVLTCPRHAGPEPLTQQVIYIHPVNTDSIQIILYCFWSRMNREKKVLNLKPDVGRNFQQAKIILDFRSQDIKIDLD